MWKGVGEKRKDEQFGEKCQQSKVSHPVNRAWMKTLAVNPKK